MVLRGGRRVRLVITVRYDIYVLYDADNDKEHPFFFDVEQLRWWLDHHEREHGGLTPLQETIIADQIPREAERWLEQQEGSAE